MDEQPTQQAGTSPAQPVAPAATTPTTAAPTNAATSTEVEAITPTDSTLTNPTPEPGKKKSKKGLIATLICLFLVLLIGGGAFAAVYIINNQPASIIASSMNHFFNAKQVEMNGSISFSVGDDVDFGVQSISLNFDDKAAGFSNSATATLNINFSDGTSAPAVELGETMLTNGVLYIKADGLNDFYNESLRDTLKTTLMSQLINGYQIKTTTDCYTSDETGDSTYCTDEYSTTVAVDPTIKTTASQAIDTVLNQVGEIVSIIDGQWIEISIDDIMNHEYFATVPSTTRQTILDAYKCSVNVLNQFSSYANEFSDLYSQNPFINMTSGQDSFYNISFDSTNLVGFLNGTNNTQFVQDMSKCNGSNNGTASLNVDAEKVESALNYLPNISARFDGFIDHQLSELKVSGQNDYFSLSSDLKFSYPNNNDITSPSDSRPVMEIVEEVYQMIEEISQSLVSV